MGRRKLHRPRGHAAPVMPAAAGPAGPAYPVADPRSAELFAPPGEGPVSITERTCLGVSGVWAAVRVIAGTVGTLPFKVYEKGADGRRADGPDAARRLARKPCPELPGSVFWETLTAHALTWGNGYAEVVRDGLGRPAELWPLTPDRVRPDRRQGTGALFYRVYDQPGYRGRAGELEPHEVFHLRGLGFDGTLGYSAVNLARRSLQIAAGGDQAAETLFQSGLQPAGWIESPQAPPTTTQKANADESVQKKHGGAGRFGKAMMLYGGMKFHQLTIDPGDAQFLQGRRFQVEEIARWFNLPPHKLRHLDRATFSNIEHQGTEFVTETLAYWLWRVAEEWGDKVLADEPGLYAEHLLDALLRGDTIARYTAYGMGRQWGFLSPNDCREKENMEPVAGGDVLHVPVNMVPLGKEGRPPADPAGGGGPLDPGAGTGAAAALAADLARQLDRADADLLDQLAGEDPDVLRQWCERAGPGEWAGRFPRHDSRLGLIQPHLRGTAYPNWSANGYALMRARALAVLADDDAAEAVRRYAAELRGGRHTAELVGLLTSKAVPA